MPKNLYEVLGISTGASKQQIKEAYRRALLQSHPDKMKGAAAAANLDFSDIKRAYDTLIHEESRITYDQELTTNRSAPQAIKTTPRPAHIVSLDLFDQEETAEGIKWTFSCRCGNVYVLLESDLENEVHTVFCNGCSESIYAGYELELDSQDC